LESNLFWNRDLAAVVNFRDILFSHREGLGRPVRFQRTSNKRPLAGKQYPQPKRIRRTPPDDGSARGTNTGALNHDAGEIFVSQNPLSSES